MSENFFSKEDLLEMYEAEKALNIKVFQDFLNDYEAGKKSFETISSTSRYGKNRTEGMLSLLERLGIISGERYINECENIENLFMIPKKYASEKGRNTNE